MCVTRLRSLHSKLKSEPKLLKEYDYIIQEQKKNGIVEIVPESEGQTLEEGKLSSRRIHYSPHHAVVRRDRETTKVRIVYDGSAKNRKYERSLNDCLEVGESDTHVPSIIPSPLTHSLIHSLTHLFIFLFQFSYLLLACRCRRS